MADRRRTDDDWRELGGQIHRARRGLGAAWTKSSGMFGKRDPHTRRAKKLYEDLGRLMVELDTRYAHDNREWTFGNPDPIFGAGNGVVRAGDSEHLGS